MHSMNMDLRSLRHVVVLSKLLSYTKAAQELCLTQSALTRSIQSIERRANARLFDRDRGGVHVTRVGRTFVERATALLREADDLERMLRRSTTADVGEVAFGMGPLAAQALLPVVLPKTIRDKPDLRTHVMVRNVETLLPALVQDEIEFFICPADPVPASAPVKSALLGWFPISLLARPKHPIFQNPHSTELRNFPVLSPGQFRNSETWPRYCRAHLAGPRHIIEDFGVAARTTEATDAIWLSSTFAASVEIRTGRLREIRPPDGEKGLRFRMMLYSLDRRSLSPAAVMFRSLFQERISELLREVQAIEARVIAGK
jgi:DNA-binding transcriptional LysR family regulator